MSIGARKNTVLTSILLLVVLPLASMICVMAVCLAAGLGDGAAGGAGLVAIALAFCGAFYMGQKSFAASSLDNNRMKSFVIKI